MRVEFSPGEWEQIEACARASQDGVNAGALRDRFGGQTFAQRRRGFAVEFVAARAFGWPDPRPGVLGRYDVGGVQVRSGPRPGAHLMVAPEDAYHADDTWLFGVELGERTFQLVGWITGRDAMVDRYWTGRLGHTLHGRVPHECWAVPGRDLRPLADLYQGGLI
jgi:hypothetical protein